MRCPRCSELLVRIVRQGVELDNCPSCLGVWFDGGEVEKVFNRLTASEVDDLPQRWEASDGGPSTGLLAEAPEWRS